MTEDEAAALLAAAVGAIAPEVDLGAVDLDLPLQEVAGIDSMDFLALVTDLHERSGIEIPYSDYPKLATLNMFMKYLMSASPHAAPM
jgi:acyl carrier protein